MMISTKQFLKLISGMTDSKPEMVLGEWESLLESVRDLKPGETVEMNGLGVFTNSDGQINFDPDDELANEVNFEYAGQDPIVIEVGESGSELPIGMSSQDLDDADEINETLASDDDKDVAEDEDYDELAIFKSKGRAKPLFPDVDQVASQKEISDESSADRDSADDVFGINDEDNAVSGSKFHASPPYIPDEIPIEAIDLTNKENFVFTLKTGSEEKKAGQDSSAQEYKSDSAKDSESKEKITEKQTHLAENLSIDNEDPEPVQAEFESENDREKTIIPDVEMEELVLAELKAKEELAKAAAESQAHKKEKEKVKQKKAKQLKDYNVYTAPRKTKSKPNPREVTRLVGIVIVVLFVIGVFIWFLMDQFGSSREGPQAASAVVQSEQTVTGVPPAAEETGIIREASPEDAIRPALADQTEEQPPMEEPDPPVQPEAITPPADPDPDPDPETEATAAASVDATPARVTETATDGYGLHGDIATVPGRSYGIVVFSFLNRENAERNEELLRDMGFRTKIIRVEQGGEMRYRVSVGQFETPETAVEAGQRLPEPYRNSFFIRRFTP